MPTRQLLNKETVLLSASIITTLTIIQRIIQVARGIAFARLLGPTEYGVYTLAFFFIPLVGTFAKLGIPACYERYASQYEEQSMLAHFFRRNYFLTLASSIIITLLCVFCSPYISKILYANTKYYTIIILSTFTVIPYVLFENFVSSFNGLRIFRLSALLKFTQFLTFTLLGISLLFFYSKAEITILANLISFMIATSTFGILFHRYILKSSFQQVRIQESEFYTKMFKYCVWFIFTPIIFSLFLYTDRWILNRILGLHAVGVYSVAINIAGIVYMFSMICGDVLLPYLSNIWEHKQNLEVNFILNFSVKISTLLLLTLALLIVIFKQYIVLLLFGTDYTRALPVINILLVFWLLNGIFLTIKIYSGLVEKTYFSFIACIVGLFFNISLNYLLIPLYGLTGAAIATTIAFIPVVFIIIALSYTEGLKVSFSTILVSLSPAILVFELRQSVMFFLLLLTLTCITRLILSHHEKHLILEYLKNSIYRVLNMMETPIT